MAACSEEALASVELTGIRKRYGPLTVADGIDLSIAHEDLVRRLGPSGCGKTTALRLIAGFIVPDEGTITVVVRRRAPARRCRRKSATCR